MDKNRHLVNRRLLAWRKWRWLALAVLLVGVGLLLRLGTVGQPPIHLNRWLPWVSPPTVTLYFPDSQGRFLVPVTRTVGSAGATAQAAVEELLQGPLDKEELSTPFPLGSRLSLFDFQEGVAQVHITTERPESADLLDISRTLEMLARTIQEFQDVESVQLLVNGSLLGDISVTSPRSHSIYYTYDSYLVPTTNGYTSPQEAIAQYLIGPDPGSGLEGLPEDVRLLEYRFDATRGLVYVNFTYTESVRRLALSDVSRMRRTLIGIVTTLTDFDEVKAVMLDFQGHTRLGLGQCADLLRAPQIRPKALNDEAVESRR